MPAFWSQAVVSQSAAMAEGRPPPMTQLKKRPDCVPVRPREASATRSSTTWAAGVPDSGKGRPSARRSSSTVAEAATGLDPSASRCASAWPKARSSAWRSRSTSGRLLAERRGAEELLLLGSHVGRHLGEERRGEVALADVGEEAEDVGSAGRVPGHRQGSGEGGAGGDAHEDALARSQLAGRPQGI